MSTKISIDNKELLTRIEQSIETKTPLSIIRKGDGENVIIGFNVIKGFNCFGIDVRNAKTNLLTTVDSQMVVASGITTSKPAIRSFLRSC